MRPRRRTYNIYIVAFTRGWWYVRGLQRWLNLEVESDAELVGKHGRSNTEDFRTLRAARARANGLSRQGVSFSLCLRRRRKGKACLYCWDSTP